jgi:hypothetical protein
MELSSPKTSKFNEAFDNTFEFSFAKKPLDEKEKVKDKEAMQRKINEHDELELCERVGHLTIEKLT